MKDKLMLKGLGGVDGQIVTIRADDYVTFKNNVTPSSGVVFDLNQAGGDFNPTTGLGTLVVIFDADGGVWHEVSRSKN